MNIGKLRNFVSFFHPTGSVGTGGGEDIFAYSDTPYAADVFASVRDLIGNQLGVARESWSEVSTEIEIRWMAGIKFNDRVVFNDGTTVRKFNVIATLDPDNGKKWRLFVMCKELSDGT